MTVQRSALRSPWLLGLVATTLTLGVTAPQASANSILEALPGGALINSVLGGQSQPRPMPLPNMDLGSDNVRNNNVNLCIVSCGGALPGGAMLPGAGMPPQARPPMARPPMARPSGPVPGAIPRQGPAPTSRPTAPASPTPTLTIPPIPIKL